ncbi:MAG TPA: hypothetical protein PKA27_15485 [Fimbriimonadaceae bacterium]|nr:hypothetical protein [Fimbriimonadaceae bacterium]
MILANATNFWARESGSGGLFLMVFLTLAICAALIFGLLQMPSRLRRPVVATFTFVSGLFYVLLWIWPQAQDRKPTDLPANFTESVSFWLSDALPKIANVSNILTAFLLGLGVFSLMRVHLTRLAKKQRDWSFSIVLLVSMISITIFGYWDWAQRQGMTPLQLEEATKIENWTTARLGQSLLFDGLLQAMDAAMFSLIAFYILSAAYRAFRIRSIEATILLASAFLVMFSLLGLADLFWSNMINAAGGSDPASFINNFRLSEIAGFIQKTFQVPGIRAIQFGIGIGALAMGLRLWLSLEKGGVS